MEEMSGFDPKRRLCPDGACTGVIGRDGRCGECGRSAEGGSGKHRADDGATENATAARSGGDTERHPETAAAPRAAGANGDGSSGFDPNRRLCEDGACVGVIGASGACTVCGRVSG